MSSTGLVLSWVVIYSWCCQVLTWPCPWCMSLRPKFGDKNKYYRSGPPNYLLNDEFSIAILCQNLRVFTNQNSYYYLFYFIFAGLEMKNKRRR
jgi:hypothetical protein